MCEVPNSMNRVEDPEPPRGNVSELNDLLYSDSEMKLINDLSHVANCNGLDTECNMPDFIIGVYLYKSIQALMEANKANGEYFKLSAQAEEEGTGI